MPTFEMHHRLALALEYAGLNVNDIARELDVHRNTIGRYLAGRHVPRPVLIAWALRTGVSLEWLEHGHVTDDDGATVTTGLTRRYSDGNGRSLPLAA